MDPVVGSALIGGAGSIASSVINAAYDNYQQNRQRQWNEQMMDKQNQWSLDMWNRTNAYNDPSAQVQRMRDAGLNPMYYGLDGSSANSFESASVLGYDRSSMPLIGNPVEGALQAAQIAKTNAETLKVKEETSNLTEQREEIKQRTAQITQNIENLKQDYKLTGKQIEQLDKTLEWIDKLNQASLDVSNSTADLNKSTKKRLDDLLEGEKLLQAKSLEDFNRRWSQIDAQIDLISEQTKIAKKDLEYYVFNNWSNGLFGSGISLQNLGKFIIEMREREQKAYEEWKRNHPDDLPSDGSTIPMPDNLNR